jgi:tRNA G46 methylase TrmB
MFIAIGTGNGIHVNAMAKIHPTQSVDKIKLHK